MPRPDGPVLVGLAGPKGGVGKSVLALNLALALSGRGLETILADLDLGGANLQPLLGLSGARPDLADFAFRRLPLSDLLRPTGQANLAFLPGSTDAPGLANLLNWLKAKLISQLHRLPARVIVADLGSGSAFNVLDLFTEARVRVLVTTPEISSIFNAYGFLKTLAYRLFLRRLKADGRDSAHQLVEQALGSSRELGSTSLPGLIEQIRGLDPQAALDLTSLLDGLGPGLVLNMVEAESETRAGAALAALARSRLGLEIPLLGRVPLDPAVRRSVREMKPLLLTAPGSPAGRAVAGLADKLLPLLTPEPDPDGL